MLSKHSITTHVNATYNTTHHPPRGSHLLHIAPLPPSPEFREIPHLDPLRPHEDAPVRPAAEIALARGRAAVVLAHGLVERDADPGGAGGAGEGGDGADEGDEAAFGGGGGEAAAGLGVDFWGGRLGG